MKISLRSRNYHTQKPKVKNTMEMLSHTPNTGFYPASSDAEWVQAKDVPVSQEEHGAYPSGSLLQGSQGTQLMETYVL